MAKTPKKVDKRTKEYRDSLKKGWKKSIPISSTLVATYTSSIYPTAVKTLSHQSQIEALQHECRSLNDEIVKLFERIANLENIVG